jgi:hypothetical protein
VYQIGGVILPSYANEDSAMGAPFHLINFLRYLPRLLQVMAGYVVVMHALGQDFVKVRCKDFVKLRCKHWPS